MVLLSNIFNKKIVLIILLACFFVTEGFSGNSEKYTTPKEMTFVFGRPFKHHVTQRLIKVYTEVLSRLQIKLKFKELPNQRSVYYLNQGLVDGDLGRLYSFSRKYKNTVRVEEPNNIVMISAFTADRVLSLNGWQSLSGTGLRIECRRGESICRENVLKYIPYNQFSEVNSVKQAIQKLFLKRTDIFIQVEPAMMKYLKTDEYRTISGGRKIYKVGVMDKLTGHAFLHKKHKQLAPKISIILKKMKNEGLFQRITRK